MTGFVQSKSIAATPVRRYHSNFMDIFSRMFRKRAPKQKSFVIPWADKRWKQVEPQEDKFTPEVVSAYFVRWLSAFGKPDPNDQEGANYAQDNDAALFEVGCYMFFYFDLMLFENHRHLRHKYSRALFSELALVFSQAFQDKEIGGLLQDRINNYCDLFRANEDATVYLHHLYQLIRRTHGGQRPGPYKFGGGEFILYDNTGESFRMQTNFIAWAKVFMASLEEVNQGLKGRQVQAEG